MNSMDIWRAICMVFAPDPNLSACTVSVPKWVASRVCVLHVTNGVVSGRSLQDGDHALLVRQPCMWSGGI